MPMLQACLNGSHSPGDRPGVPVTPEELARAAAGATAAGAESLHVHPRDARGRDTVDPDCVDAVLVAIRAAVTGIAIGVTTGEWTEPDPVRRVARVRGWRELPDFASVNWHEPGAEEMSRALLDRGVGIEAGLCLADVAESFAVHPLAPACLRVLIEVTDQDLESATGSAVAMERAVRGLGLPMLLHGEDAVAWAMVDRALRSGFDTRIGLEDAARLPDGTHASDNAAQTGAVVARLRAFAEADEQAIGRDVRVTQPHRPPDRPPVQVHAGDSVRIGDRDDQWPAFILVTARDGGAGWVPSRHLVVSTGGGAVAARDYDTTELAVDAGATLTVVEADTMSGWLWCRRSDGAHGWVPIARTDARGISELAAVAT